MKTCPKCKNQVNDNAKFCGKCGTSLAGMSSSPVAGASSRCASVGDSGFVRWTMLTGQVAVKITEDEVAACGKVKGIVISEGTSALFFVNGRIVSELGAGCYRFSDLISGTAPAAGGTPSNGGGFWGLLRSAGEAAARAAASIGQAIAAAAGQKNAVSVVLVRSTEFPLVFDVKDAPTAGIRSEIGLHVVCRVDDINGFFGAMLADRRFVSFVEVRAALERLVDEAVRGEVTSFEPGRVAGDAGLRLTLQRRLSAAVASVYPFLSVVRVVQVTAANEALDELRRMGEELYVSEQELVQLQKRNDFLNRLQAVKNEQELTSGHADADFAAKKLEIYKQMQLTEAEREKFDLMLEAEKQLRVASAQEEINAAVHALQKSGLVREQELEALKRQGALADIRDQQTQASIILEGELARRRAEAAFADERKRQAAAFAAEQREKEMTFEERERAEQLKTLAALTALKQQQKDAEHQRQMEAARLEKEAELEKQRIYAGMSVEQIMATNPDISAAAAQALAQKFSAEHKDELLKMREADAAAMNERQMEMIRMMQQMGMAGMAAGARPAAPQPPAARVCRVCGAPITPGSLFCGSCGATL